MELDTAWMIRNDGTAFSCVCHTYGSTKEIEETLAAAQWLYAHTAKASTRALCMELIYTWGSQFSSEETGIVQKIYQAIDSRPYRFLSKDFIATHREELRTSMWERPLADMNEEVNLELNQEFLRGRYGGLYDTVPGSREMFFRISSIAFDWYPIIRDFVERSDLLIESITIVRDAESTGGDNRPYRTLSGHGVYRQFPVQDFLAEGSNPAAAGKRLAVGTSDSSVAGSIIKGLAARRSLWELHDLPINWERLKQKVKRHSMRELALTEERSVGTRNGAS